MFNGDHSTRDGEEIMSHMGDDGKFVLMNLQNSVSNKKVYNLEIILLFTKAMGF